MAKHIPGIIEKMISESPEAPQEDPAFSCWWLWIQVLSQAVRDAQNNINSSEMQHEKRHAKAWLCGCGKDFANVCNLCGFEPKWAAERFRKYFEDRPE